MLWFGTEKIAADSPTLHGSTRQAMHQEQLGKSMQTQLNFGTPRNDPNGTSGVSSTPTHGPSLSDARLLTRQPWE